MAGEMQPHESQDVTSPKRRLRKYSYKEALHSGSVSKADMSATIIEEVELDSNPDKPNGNGASTPATLTEKLDKDEYQRKSTGQKLDSMVDAINRLCDKVGKMETQLEEKVKPMEEALFTGEDNMTTILKQMAENIESVEKQMQTVMEANVDLRDEVEILKGTVHKQSNQITALQHKLTDQIARSMENNLIITGIMGDTPKANTRNQVLRFLSETLEINFNPYDVLEVNRMGAPIRNKSRPILVQCTIGLRKFIVWNIENLQSKTNANGERYFINQQVPEQIAEQKRENRQIIKETRKLEEHKKDNEKSTILVRNNVLYINGEKKKKQVTPPTVLQLFPEEDEQRKINKIKFVNTDTRPERGSTFTAHACKVMTVEEVRKAYIRISQDFPSADHIAVAYSVRDTLGFHDNQEFGSGFRLLDTIKASMEDNIAVFLVRQYGGTHLGPRRFTIMRELTEEVLQKIRK